MISGASDEELDIAIARADVLLELQPKIDELKKENQELKKQKQEWIDLLNMFKNQQKGFIKWLESEIKACELTCDLIFNHNKEMKIYKEILSKYKEIIGDKE